MPSKKWIINNFTMYILVYNVYTCLFKNEPPYDIAQLFFKFLLKFDKLKNKC